MLDKPAVLDARQRLALVYLHQRRQITNSDYRRLNHVDSIAASQELRRLAQAGLIEQKGMGRWTTYIVKKERVLTEEIALQTDEGKTLAYVRTHGSINNSKCIEFRGIAAYEDGSRKYQKE